MEERKEEKERFYPPVEGLDVVAYCRELSAWLEAQHKMEGNLPKAEKHFKGRVSSLVQTQNQAEKAQVDIDLPSMGDLNNLTELAEQSSPCVVGLNVIISFLLILGIFGTLWGIHYSMSDADSLQGLSELGPALLPSAWAVGITVILMMAKGIYQYKHSHYMSALNRFTLLYLIPHLQRDAHADAVMGQVETAAEGFFDTVTSVPQWADAVQQNQSHLLRNIATAREMIQRLIHLQKQLEERFGEVRCTKDVAKKHGDLLERAIGQMEEQMQRLQNAYQDAKKLAVTYTNILTKFGDLEQGVAIGLETETERVTESTPLLKESRDTLSGIDSHIQSVRAKEREVLRIKEELETLRSAMEQRKEAWHEVRTAMDHFREHAASTQATAKGMGEQASLQVRETEKFLHSVVPPEWEEGMKKLSKRMTSAASTFRDYAQGIEEQSRLPLLSRKECVGLGLLGSAVVLKLVWMYL